MPLKKNWVKIFHISFKTIGDPLLSLDFKQFKKEIHLNFIMVMNVIIILNVWIQNILFL
jgi:hypothetical protein